MHDTRCFNNHLYHMTWIQAVLARTFLRLEFFAICVSSTNRLSACRRGHKRGEINHRCTQLCFEWSPIHYSFGPMDPGENPDGVRGTRIS